MIVSIAWKNIWRNKLRSSVVIAAMSIGLLSGIFSVALMNGFLLARVDNVIKNEVSSIQLHQVDYLKNNELQHRIPNADKLVAEINQYPEVAAASRRLKIEAMISSPRAATGANILGINPQVEKEIGDIDRCIADSNGAYFEGVKRTPVLISAKLAERLKVGLRKRITIQTIDQYGEITGGNFKVVGIFKTKNGVFDEMNVFVRYEDLRNLLKLEEGDAHEIAILTKDITHTDSLKQKLVASYTRYQITASKLLKAKNDSLANPMLKKLETLISHETFSQEEFCVKLQTILGNEDYSAHKNQLLSYFETGINVMDWKDLAPDVRMMSSYMDYMMVIFVGIILLALGFGIVNTMLMAVLERVKELGMLMAVGMNSRKIFRMIMVETILLCLTGGIIGMGLSLGALAMVSLNGLDLSMMQEGMEAMGFSTHIFPSISTRDYIQVALMVIAIGILASIYPALRAIRLNPADAIRSE